MNTKKKKIIVAALSIIGVIAAAAIILLYNYTFFFKSNSAEPIGIIDTYLSKDYNDVICNETAYVNEDKSETHGDTLLSFLKDCGYEGDTYYYAAINDKGKITTEGIIDGLNYMADKGVKKVNLSLSSKNYSNELNEWIQNHKDIQVYASYNNNLNTAHDYPAMYDSVIGSGSNSKIRYKDLDKSYHNNNILVLNNGFHYYNGNSYLSIITMIKN